MYHVSSQIYKYLKRKNHQKKQKDEIIFKKKRIGNSFPMDNNCYIILLA